MKILIVMPNFNCGGAYFLPLGILYVSAYLKRAGFDVDAINLNHYGPDKLTEVLRSKPYDVVATGGLFPFYANYRVVIDTTRRVLPGARVVLGGAVASADPEFVSSSLKPDHLVLGEGELPMEGLLRALQAGAEPDNVPGTAFFRDGRLTKNPPPPPPDLDSLPWPDYEGFEFGRYLESGYAPEIDQNFRSRHAVRRVVPVISSRGCPSKCTFCFQIIPLYRYRSVSGIIAEIKHLKQRYGINELYIFDENFSARADRIHEFCRGIRDMDIDWICQMRVPLVTDEILKTMKAAGCICVGYGLESMSPEVLRSMRKGTKPEQIKNALRLSWENDLTLNGQFIFGDPAETWETAQETLDFYREHRKDYAAGIDLGIIIPYPGTLLYNDLVKKGRIRDLRRFYETYLDENNRHINMTSMPDKEFYRLIYEVLPAEERKTAAFSGAARGAREIGPDHYEFEFACPLCGKSSAEQRLKLAADFPIKSFRLVCPHCHQRAFVSPLSLLGPAGLARYRSRVLWRRAWDRFRATRLFARVRYHPELDSLWQEYKDRIRGGQEGASPSPDGKQVGAAALRFRFLAEYAGLCVLRLLGLPTKKRG